jgi:dihydropteroate synthase
MLFRARQFEYVFPRPRLVMGVVNVTPDSFSDGGKFFDANTAVAHGEELVRQGADILDVGGESTRPKAEPVSEAEELRRVIPVITELAIRVKIPISIDTMKPAVAGAALQAGASIVNDVSANRTDDAMWRLVAQYNAGYIAMHMQGTPQTMQFNPHYEDVVREVFDDLTQKVERAVNAGIASEAIAVDPGIGFGKSFEHNLMLLKNLETFAGLGCVVLVGTSRKGFLGKLTGKRTGDQTIASVTSALAAASAGARVVRVHDVGPTVDAFRVWEGHRGWNDPNFPG